MFFAAPVPNKKICPILKLTTPFSLHSCDTFKVYFFGVRESLGLRTYRSKITKNDVKIREVHQNFMRSRKFIPEIFLKMCHLRKFILAKLHFGSKRSRNRTELKNGCDVQGNFPNMKA